MHFQGTRNTENPLTVRYLNQATTLRLPGRWEQSSVTQDPSEGMTESQEAVKGDETESRRALSATDEQFSSRLNCLSSSFYSGELIQLVTTPFLVLSRIQRMPFLCLVHRLEVYAEKIVAPAIWSCTSSGRGSG